MTLPYTFFNPKLAQEKEKANHSSKKKTRGKKGKEKKKFKSQKA